MVSILMIPAKLATLGLLEIKAFWNKVCDVIVFVYEVTNKVLSRDSSYIVDVVMWPKFGNLSISMREVVNSFNYIRIWPDKPIFLRGAFGSSSIILDWH